MEGLSFSTKITDIASAVATIGVVTGIGGVVVLVGGGLAAATATAAIGEAAPFLAVSVIAALVLAFFEVGPLIIALGAGIPLVLAIPAIAVAVPAIAIMVMLTLLSTGLFVGGIGLFLAALPAGVAGAIGKDCYKG